MKKLLFILLFCAASGVMKADDVVAPEATSTAVVTVPVVDAKIFDKMFQAIKIRQFMLVMIAVVVQASNEKLNEQLMKLRALYSCYTAAVDNNSKLAADILNEAEQLSKTFEDEQADITEGLNKMNKVFKKEFPSYKKAAANQGN